MNLRKTRKEIYCKMTNGVTVTCTMNRSTIDKSNKLPEGSAKELHRKNDTFQGFEEELFR